MEGGGVVGKNHIQAIAPKRVAKEVGLGGGGGVDGPVSPFV